MKISQLQNAIIPPDNLIPTNNLHLPVLNNPLQHANLAKASLLQILFEIASLKNQNPNLVHHNLSPRPDNLLQSLLG